MSDGFSTMVVTTYSQCYSLSRAKPMVLQCVFLYAMRALASGFSSAVKLGDACRQPAMRPRMRSWCWHNSTPYN